MFTIIWGVYGFYVIDMLPNDCKYNSQYFIDNILQKLIEKDQEIWPRKSNHKIWIHIDNCSVHNSMATENFSINLILKELLIHHTPLILHHQTSSYLDLSRISSKEILLTNQMRFLKP